MRISWAGTAGVASIAGLAACSLLTNLDGLAGPPLDTGDAGDATGPGDGAPSPDGSESGAGEGGAAGATVAVIGGATPAGRVGDVWVATLAEDGTIVRWTAAAPLPEERYRAAGAAGFGHVFVMGGETSSTSRNTTLVATVAGGTITGWTVGPPTPYTPGIVRLGALLFGSRMVIVGGDDGTAPANTNVFSVGVDATGVVGAWTTAPPLPVARASAAVAISGLHAYVVGGYTLPAMSTGATSIGDVSSGELTSWATGPALGLSVEAPAGAATATHIYVSGGYGGTKNDYVKSAAVLGDGSLGAWADATSMRTQRVGHGLVVIGQHLYAVAGSTTDGTDQPLDSVEVSDIAPDGSLSAWRTLLPLPVKTAFHVTVAIPTP